MASRAAGTSTAAVTDIMAVGDTASVRIIIATAITPIRSSFTAAIPITMTTMAVTATMILMATMVAPVTTVAGIVPASVQTIDVTRQS